MLLGPARRGDSRWGLLPLLIISRAGLRPHHPCGFAKKLAGLPLLCHNEPVIQEKALKTIEFDKVLALMSDFAASSAGKSRCLALRPEENEQTIKKNLSLTSEARRAYSLAGNSLPIGELPDISAFWGKLKNKLALSAEEIRDILTILTTSRAMSSYLNRFALDCPLLGAFSEMLFASGELENAIETVFDAKFEVKETASAELKALFQSKRSLSENLKNLASDLLNNPSFALNLQEHIYTFREGRIVFAVKAEAKNRVNGIVHDVSASGQTFFIEPRQIVELNNRIRETESAIEAEIAKIIKILSEKLGEFAQEIRISCETLAELDFVFAKAKYSASIDACEPEVVDEKIVELKSMKNPVLMSVCENVIENDFEIGSPFKSIIITGSNAGGKTVVLKTVALSIAMTAAGLHIPCYSAKIYPFKKLFAEIGDEQNIIQSLSTFSSHVKNIKNILDNVDDETFILIDEIAAGTDPKEGAALAKAVMERFIEKNALSVITTHFNELKSLPFNNNAFQNASVDFDVESLRPTYKLRIGVPGASNAFAIAQNLGIDEKIIENAKNEYSAHISDESRVLASLQEKYSELNRLSAQTEALRAEAEEKFNKYNELLEKTNAQKRKALSDFKKRYENAISDAKIEIKSVLESLSKNKTRENALNAYKKISRSGKSLGEQFYEDAKEISTKYIELENVAVGDKAVIKDLDQDVEILSLPDKRGNLQILIGQLKTTINIKKLAKAMREKRTITRKKYKFSSSNVSFARLELSPKLDLRGERVDDALIELEAYLDKASLANLTPVQIIHGHGSGQLRHAIRDYLDDSPYVAKYRPGEPSEGGDGVTIIDIN